MTGGGANERRGVSANPPTPNVLASPLGSTPIHGLALLVCHSSLKRRADNLQSTVRLGLELDPMLSDITTVFGPEIVSTGFLGLSARSLAGRVHEGFLAEIPRWAVEGSDQLVLCVVVVGVATSQVADLLELLIRSPEFATMPILLRGLALDGEPAPNTRIVTLPPDSLTRADEILVWLIGDMIGEAESETGAPLSVAQIKALTGVSPRVVDEIPDPPDPEDAVQGGSLRGAVDTRYLTSPEGSPIQVIFIAVASGLESRPKRIRAREAELAVALDRVLHGKMDFSLGQTWVIQMGLTIEPVAVSGGTLLMEGLHRPGSAHIDLTAEIERISRTIRRVSESYDRRAQKMVRPVVVIILPPLTTTGYRFVRAIEELDALAHTCWLVVGDEEPNALRKLPTDRIFRDKPDVVNEVAHHMLSHRNSLPDDSTTDDTMILNATTDLMSGDSRTLATESSVSKIVPSGTSSPQL